jgi:solute:Na+ symporter, SSS family
MPRLWVICRRRDYVTAADFVEGCYGSRGLALAVAVTGILATMRYIALQLVGMQVVIAALGFGGQGVTGTELPLAIAFVILAVYTYTSGLRAPALIAFVKDVMIYAVVIVAVIVIPLRLGGYGAVFTAAEHAFAAKGGATGLLLAPQQMLPFASLALGSALAAFMYPHTMTGILSAASADAIRRNAIFLPAYTILLGLIALLGYMAHAAGITVASPSEVVPALFLKTFPDWFVGFAFAAIAIGALVPAAVMSIGSANLFTRNIWRAYVRRPVSPEAEARTAKLASLVVKLGALIFVVFLPTKFAIDLQLLGGIWILQIFPAVAFGLYTRFLRSGPLLVGWAVGMALGTGLAWADGLQPVHSIVVGGARYTIYIGLLALAGNVIVAVVGSLIRHPYPTRQPWPT